MSVVFWKELADHFSSRRFMILLAIIVLTGVWAIYASGQSIRQDAESAPVEFVFLLLVTSQSGGLLSLATFLGDRKSTRLNSSHIQKSRMPSSA